MKKLLSIIFIVLTIASILTACDTGKVDDIKGSVSAVGNESTDEYFEYFEDELDALTEKGKKQKELVIPENFSSYPEPMFQNDTNLESITFLNDDIVLMDSTFWGCINLKSCDLPKNTQTIPYMFFITCSSLEYIDIPDSVITIESEAFESCSSLSKVNFGSGLKTIESQAFYDCDSLTEIKLPEGLVSIGEEAFAGCENLTTVYLPETVTEIGESAFTQMLKEITIYVKQGSWADKNFDSFAKSSMIKEYY